jgi:hypothetical protein
MNDCFIRSKYVQQDKQNVPLHAAHPSLSQNPGRTSEQIAKEQAINQSTQLINPLTHGRR